VGKLDNVCFATESGSRSSAKSSRELVWDEFALGKNVVTPAGFEPAASRVI
jgi:hypothetical protein